MFQDNPLLAQLKQQIRENIPKKEGVIRASDRGFGFLEVDEKTSYFVPPPYMKKVMHGDRVSANTVSSLPSSSATTRPNLVRHGERSPSRFEIAVFMALNTVASTCSVSESSSIN